MTNSDLPKVVACILARMGSSHLPATVILTLDCRWLSTVTQEEHIIVPFRVFKNDGRTELSIITGWFRLENVIPKIENQYKKVTTPTKAN